MSMGLISLGIELLLGIFSFFVAGVHWEIVWTIGGLVGVGIFAGIAPWVVLILLITKRKKPS